MDIAAYYSQVPVNPETCFRLFIHFEPSLWSEFIGVGSPHVLVTVKKKGKTGINPSGSRGDAD